MTSGPGSRSSSQKHYAAIDGLRAVAIAAVVVYHIHGAWLPAGYLGVDMFFVISGFLVSSSVSQFSGPFHKFMAFFYSRRLSRIVPPLIAAICLTTLFTILFVPFNWLNVANENMAQASHVGLANLSLLESWNDYFSPQAQYHSFTHMWSLAVEEQFYLLFPLLFFPWLGWPKKRWLSVTGMIAIAVASIALALKNIDDVSYFFLLQSRIWQLCLGVIAFQISNVVNFDRLTAKWVRFFDLLMQLTFVGIILSFWFLPSLRFPGAGAFLVAGGTALLILAFKSDRGGFVQIALSASPVQALGRISYSLYLYHWPVIVVLLWTTGIQSLGLKATALALSLGLAIASYIVIEKPTKNWRSRTALRPAFVIIGFISLLAVSFAANSWMFNDRSQIALTTFSNQWNRNELPEALRRADRCAVTKSLSASDETLSITPAPTCKTPIARTSFFALGDSHVLAYDALFEELASRLHSTTKRYARGGCPFVDLRNPSEDVSVECKKFLEHSREEILATAKRGDILFLSSLRLVLLADQNGIIYSDFNEMTTPWMASKREKSILEAKNDLAPFLKRGMFVIFEAPPPIFLTPVFRCTDWFNRGNPVCAPGFEMDRNKLLSYRSPVMDGLRRVQAEVDPTGIFIWDPFQVLCPTNDKSRCSAFRSGRSLFIDTHHLSAFGSLLLLPDFIDFVTKIRKEQGREVRDKADGDR